MFFDIFKKDHVSKVKKIKIKSTENEEISQSNDEIIGEVKIIGNQGYMRTIYKFENGKAVSCMNEIESDSEVILDSYDKDITKNVQRQGNIVRFEWTDEYFEEKCKGCSPKEVKMFLRLCGYKIKKVKEN